MESIEESLELLDRHVARAVAAAAADGSSAVLRAVLGEFQRKAAKARAELAAGKPVRECVIEVEQAGDSAKIGAAADPGAADHTKELVTLAHDAICMLKAQLP
jgi:hypothetical protein